MKLIVGLGNPGEKYKFNRHSVGAIILNELLLKKNLTWEENAKLKGKLCKIGDIIFFRPSVFMNSCGESVSLVLNFYKIDPSDLLVIHDDLDLPFGEVKKQFASGAAGHHGVESIISNLGTKDFSRVRIGIGRPTNAQPVEDFVLSNFSEEELKKITALDLDQLTAFE